MASVQVNSSGTIRIGSYALLSRGSAAFICRSSSRCYQPCKVPAGVARICRSACFGATVASRNARL